MRVAQKWFMADARSIEDLPSGPAARPHADARRDLADARLDEVEAVAGIGSYTTDIVASRWESSPGLDAIFGIDATFDRSVDAWASLVHPDDREEMLRYFAEDVVGRGTPFDREYRIVRADTGEERWVHGRGRLEMDGSGRPIRMLGTIADITLARRTQEALVRSEARYATVFEGALEAILIAEQATGRFRYANAAASSLLGWSREDFQTLSVRDIHPPDAVAAVLEDFAAMASGTGILWSVPCLRRDGTILLADIRSSPAEIDGVPCVVGFFADVTELRQTELRNRRLAAAVEQASDSLLITDITGAIEYANPAFERMSGYRSAEVLGQNPRILKSGRQPASFYRMLWRHLTKGQSWSGTLFNRRKDGSTYEVEATISPLHDSAGETTGYIGIERDVTAVRAAETALVAEIRERAEVAAALARLQPSPSAADTAASICDELLALTGIEVAAIVDFPETRRAVTLAARGPEGLPVAPGRPIPLARATYLYDRASQGPWAEVWRVRPEDGAYGQAMADMRIKAIAYAPIRNGDRLLGVVAAGTRDDVYARHLIDHLPIVGEFAATASALLSGGLESAHRSEQVRKRVERILAEQSFEPVFQPIFVLSPARPIGHEALTRVSDGTPPDRMLAEARAVGLGPDLELAFLKAALLASEELPSSGWLALNISPDVLLRADELRQMIAPSTRPIVLELTEHVEIDDYAAVRRAVATLGPRVSLSVDDAGAGFASLRHVVELRPHFLKIDIGLVRGVDRDPTRQAMIAGLAHFAARSGCEVIAEGIEEQAELEMLCELGVALGQGYLLGRPDRVSHHPRGSRLGTRRRPVGCAGRPAARRGDAAGVADPASRHMADLRRAQA
jgi:PAS domain S-box-containing protein